MNQFLKIKFSETLFSIIKYFPKFSKRKYFSKKNFEKKLLHFFEIFCKKIDFQKLCFRKFNLQKLIHVSWDKIDNFLKLQYLQGLTSDFIALSFFPKILMSTVVQRCQMFRLGTIYSSYGPLKLAKNNHISTAIDQFSTILFSKE